MGKSTPTTETPGPGCLVISADPSDPEAAAAACILVHKSTDFMLTLREGVCFLSDHMDVGIAGHRLTITTARALVVILSTETLCSHHQLEIIAHAIGLNEKGQGPATIPANAFGFSFPSLLYYAQVLPRIWPEVNEAQVRHIGAFFRTISCPYSTHASDQVMQQQIKTILQRIPVGQNSSACDSFAAGNASAISRAMPPTVLEGRSSASEDIVDGKCIQQQWV